MCHACSIKENWDEWDFENRHLFEDRNKESIPVIEQRVKCNKCHHDVAQENWEDLKEPYSMEYSLSGFPKGNVAEWKCKFCGSVENFKHYEKPKN